MKQMIFNLSLVKSPSFLVRCLFCSVNHIHTSELALPERASLSPIPRPLGKDIFLLDCYASVTTKIYHSQQDFSNDLNTDISVARRA